MEHAARGCKVGGQLFDCLESSSRLFDLNDDGIDPLVTVIVIEALRVRIGCGGNDKLLGPHDESAAGANVGLRSTHSSENQS